MPTVMKHYGCKNSLWLERCPKAQKTHVDISVAFLLSLVRHPMLLAVRASVGCPIGQVKS